MLSVCSFPFQMRAVPSGGPWTPLAPASRLFFSFSGAWDGATMFPAGLMDRYDRDPHMGERRWQSAVIIRQRKDANAWGQIFLTASLCFTHSGEARTSQDNKPPPCVSCAAPVHTSGFLRMANGPSGCGEPMDRQGSGGGWLCLLVPPGPIPTVGC